MRNLLKRYSRQTVLFIITTLLVYFIYIKPGISYHPLVLFYNIISFIILGGAIVLFHMALNDEFMIQEVNLKMGDPGEKAKWSKLWSEYQNTFLNGYKRTTEPAISYFNPENMLDASMERVPLLVILKSIPSTFTGLGILGTFMGFAAGLSHFDTSTTESMQESIKTLLTGINTAFNTSIIGLVLSITFNFIFLQPLMKRLDKECQALANRLDDKYYIDSVDHLKEMLAFEEEGQVWLPRDYNKEMLAQLRNQTRSLANFTTDLSDAISNLASALIENYRKQMQEMISGDLKPILENLSNAAELLLKEKIESTDQALENVVERLNAALTQFLADLKENIAGQTKMEMEGLAANIKLAGDSLNQFPQLMNDLKDDVGYLLSKNEEAMNKITLDSVGLVSDALQDLRKYSDETKTLMESFRDTVRTSESQNRYAAQISQSLEILSKTASEASLALEQSFQEYEKHSGAVLQSISEQAEGLRQAAQTVQSASQGFNGLDKSLADSFKVVIDGLNEYREATKAGLEEYLEKYSSSMTNFAGRLSSAVEELKDVVEELQDTFAKQEG